jgi:hypothetical protein
MAILYALNNHKINGCCALSRIALLPGGKKALADANAAAAIKVALQDHAESADVVEWGRIALANVIGK